MAEFNNEEEQLEALKEWWKENGRSVIAGIVLGAAALFGYKFWQDYRVEQAREASSIVADMQALARGDEVGNLLEQAASLKSDYKRTPYAGLGALDAASAMVARGQLAEAEQELRWATDNAQLAEVQEVARVRLARVLIEQGRAQEALDALKVELPESFAGLVEELRGDAYRALGDLEAARNAYDRALLYTGGASEYLQLKRDDLGAVSAQGEQAS